MLAIVAAAAAFAAEAAPAAPTPPAGIGEASLLCFCCVQFCSATCLSPSAFGSAALLLSCSQIEYLMAA